VAAAADASVPAGAPAGEALDCASVGGAAIDRTAAVATMLSERFNSAATSGTMPP